MAIDMYAAASAALLSMLLCAVLTRIAIRIVRRSVGGASVREDVPATHQAKTGTPSMGGVAIVAAIVISLLLALSVVTEDVGPMVIVVCGMVLYAMIGFWDDYTKALGGGSRGVLARYRIALEIALGLAFAWLLWREAPHAGAAGALGFGWLPVEVRIALGALVVTGSANAANLTDGLDGLAAGVSAIGGLGLAAVCAMTGQPGLAVLALCISGAAAGFLWYNSKPAAIWMGDVGSLGLGAALALVAVAARVEWAYAIIAGVFVVEALSVILQVIYFRSSGGQRLFPMSPIHHSFELIGWSEPKIVTRLWLAAVAFALLGVMIAAAVVRQGP